MRASNTSGDEPFVEAKRTDVAPAFITARPHHFANLHISGLRARQAQSLCHAGVANRLRRKPRNERVNTIDHAHAKSRSAGPVQSIPQCPLWMAPALQARFDVAAYWSGAVCYWVDCRRAAFYPKTVHWLPGEPRLSIAPERGKVVVSRLGLIALTPLVSSLLAAELTLFRRQTQRPWPQAFRIGRLSNRSGIL